MEAYISIQEPIAAAKMQLGISHSTEDPYFLLKAREAEFLIASENSIVKKQETLTIDKLTAHLPCDFYLLNSVRLNDDDCCTYPRYVSKHFIDKDDDCPNTFESIVDETFDIRDGCIYFSSAVTATTCDISYKGYNLDEDGFPKIHHEHDVAIQNYILWQYTLRDADRYNQYMVESYMRIWQTRCQQARNRSRRRGWVQQEYLKACWNSMLAPHRMIR